MVMWQLRPGKEPRFDLPQDGQRIASFRIAVERNQEDLGPWGLALSVVFDDGVMGCYVIDQADNREKMSEKIQQFKDAELVDGRIVLQNGEILDFHHFYGRSSSDFHSGKPPYDLGSPWFRFRR